MNTKHFKNMMYARARENKSDVIPCAYCGKNLPRSKATVDHVRPKMTGGQDKPYNFRICCFDCNNKKADTPLKWFKNNKELK